MKKSIVIIIGIILCLLIIGVASAQSIDQERMDRDLAVASNVLKSMINQEGNRMSYMGGNSVEANYLMDYGVIFTLAGNGFSYRMNVETPDVEFLFAPTVPTVPQKSDRDQVEKEFERAKQDMEEAKRERKIAMQDRENAFIEERVSRSEGRAPNAMVLSGMGDSDELIESVKSFLVDYTNLIGQLRPSDKIMVKLRSNNVFTYLFQQSERNIGRVAQKGPASAEITVSVINDYKSGKIDREAAIEKITIVESEDIMVEEDIRLFSNILKTVYETNISKSYFMSDRPAIERLKDFGVIYHARFYSSNPLGFGENIKHNMPTLGLKDISQEERDKKVKEMLDPFIEDLKSNLVEYGRTISSLENDESVVLKARMTACDGCGIPESLELTVKASVLKEYSSGKINKSSAVSKVASKKIGKQ